MTDRETEAGKNIVALGAADARPAPRRTIANFIFEPKTCFLSPLEVVSND